MNNKDFFNRKFGGIYTPDNSEDENDLYTYESFLKEVTEFWEEHSNDLGYDNIDLFVNDIISVLDWQFPSTVMTDILNGY